MVSERILLLASGRSIITSGYSPEVTRVVVVVFFSSFLHSSDKWLWRFSHSSPRTTAVRIFLYFYLAFFSSMHFSRPVDNSLGKQRRHCGGALVFAGARFFLPFFIQRERNVSTMLGEVSDEIYFFFNYFCFN